MRSPDTAQQSDATTTYNTNNNNGGGAKFILQNDNCFLAIPHNTDDVTIPDDDGRHDYMLVTINGTKYNLYRTWHLECPECDEPKWVVCSNPRTIFERDCRCPLKAGANMPPFLTRLRDVFDYALGCVGCGRIPRVKINKNSIGIENIHYSQCQFGGRLPRNESDTHLLMCALFQVRDDYARILVKCLNEM